MTDIIRSQVRELYARLKATHTTREFSTFLALAPLIHEEDGAAAVKSLRHAYDSLDDVFQALVSAGQIAQARRVKGVMDEIAAVSISINRAVIAYLDGAADVAAATQRIRGAGKDLKEEAERLTADVSKLGDVSTALEIITQIVEL